MIKNYTLAKKLTSYSAFASAIIAMSSAKAQILYTDVNPDTSFGAFSSRNEYLLDLNNDGIIDYRLKHEGFFHSSTFKGFNSSNELTIQGLANNQINDQRFSSGEIIPSDPNELGSHLYLARVVRGQTRVGSYFFTNTSVAGAFLNVPDAYVGLAFHKKGKIYYGWVRLQTAGAEEATIKSYAIDTIPGQVIQAGYTGCYSTNIPAIIPSTNIDTLFSTIAFKYQWYENNIPVSEDTNRYLIPASNGNYNVITKDSADCSSISNPYLFINCNLVRPIIISLNSTTICPGFGKDTLKLDSGNYTSFQWYKNDTLISKATSPFYIASVPGKYNINVVDNFSCTGSSNIETIKFDPLPDPPIVSLSGDTLVSSAKFNLWFAIDNHGDLNYFDQSHSEYFVPFYNFYYVAEAEDTFGCPSSPSNRIYDFISCNTAAAPIISESAEDSVACFPDSINFYLDNPSNFNSDSVEFQWLRNNSDLPFKQPNFFVHQSGNYSLVVNEGYGCASDTSNSIQVQIDTVPKPSITRKNDTLISSSLNGNQWYLNGSPIENATANKIIIDTTGNYSVIVTDVNWCSNTSDVYPETVTGINNSTIENLKLYVSNNQLYVQLPDIFYIGGILKVYNSLGQLVLQRNISSEHFAMDLRAFSSGVYIVKLEKKGDHVVRKIFL